MRRIFSLIRSNKIWAGVSGLLITLGGAAYLPVVSIGQTAAQESVEAYCEANPESENCPSDQPTSEDGDS